MGCDLDIRKICGTWHGIIHERSAEQLAAIRIIGHLFGQGLADALGDTAMDLAFDDDRVDHIADVVDHPVTDDLGHARVRVYLDLADVAAIGIGIVFRGKGRGLEQAGLDTLRQSGGRERSLGDIGQGNAAVCARDRERTICELHINHARFEHMGRYCLSLFDDLFSSEIECRASDHGRPGPHGTNPEGNPVRITVDHPHPRRIKAETLVHDLLVDRLMPLTLALGAHQYRCGTVCTETDFSKIRRRGGRPLDRVGGADAAQFSTRARFFPAPRKSLVIRHFEHGSLVPGEFATIIGEAKRVLHRHGVGRDHVART